MASRLGLGLAALIALAGYHDGCSAQAQVPSDAQKMNDLLTKGPAGQTLSPACGLLTQQEAAAALGRAVKNGEVAAHGTACHWTDQSGEGQVLVSVVPVYYWSPPSLGKGFHSPNGLELEAYAVPDLSG